MSSIISASEEPITQDGTVQTTLQKIESWASIASDATYSSWQDTKNDFLKFTDRMRFLAENNSFFEDDEDDSDSDDEESDNESVSGDEDEIPSYPIDNNSMNQLIAVNLMKIGKNE